MVGSCGAECSLNSHCSDTVCHDYCSGSYNIYYRNNVVNDCTDSCTCESNPCPTGTLTSCGTQTCTDVCDNANNRFKDYTADSCSKGCIEAAGDHYCEASCCGDYDQGWTNCGTTARTCTAGENCQCEAYNGGERLRCDTGTDTTCDNGCTASECNPACTPPACDREWLESDDDGDGYYGSCDICDSEIKLTYSGDPDYEAVEATCDDGIDNDCDGDTDLNDPDCPCSAADTSANCSILSTKKTDAGFDGCDWCTNCTTGGPWTTWTINTGTNIYTPNQYYAAYGTGVCMERGACTDYACVVDKCGSGCTVPSIEDQNAGEDGECDDSPSPDNHYCNDSGNNGLTDVYRVYKDFQCNVGVDCGCYDTGDTYERFNKTRCVDGECGAGCDADTGCDPTTCDDHDGCWGTGGTTWREGCQLGDEYCVYFEFDNIPNDCDLASSCTCPSNACAVPAAGCNPFAGGCDSTNLLVYTDDKDSDGWSDQCDDLFISIPNQSMSYLELYPFEKVAVKGYATFTPQALPSCDEPWMVDEVWNKSASGDWRVGCETGPKMDAEFLWSAPFEEGVPYYYEIFWDRGTNSRCDFGYGEFRHFDFMGCDQSAVHYWDKAQIAQAGFGDPAMDGTTFAVLSPVFWYNDVELTFSVSEGLGSHAGEFHLQGIADELSGESLTITTKCMLGSELHVLEVLKESPSELDADPISDTAAAIGDETDWVENLGTDQQIQPWDHLYLIYVPTGDDFTLELQANDFLSDLYLDDVLVTQDKVDYCSESGCYCEHFAENCAKVSDEATGRTVKMDLGYLPKGFHKLKFKVVDVWMKGFATGVKIYSDEADAGAPTYTCTDAVTGASTDFECYIGSGLENHGFCRRPQHIGCISYIDDPDEGDSVFDNVLQTHMYLEYADCPTTCICEPAADYYLNTLTGYCESLCCTEWPCPGCCDERCTSPHFIQ